MADQLVFIAVGGAVSHYDLLGPKPVEQWDRIQKYLSSEWKSGDQGRLLAMSGCLDKLSTSLLQVHRIKDFHQELLNTASMNLGKGPYAFLRGEIACADFESLLLQGRAALDRLTWFVTWNFKGQNCDSFRRLGNVLENFQHKSHLAKNLLGLVRQVSPWTTRLLSSIERDDSLRDFVAHKGATTEKMTSCFGITFLDNQRAILFDCELDPFPLFKTSFEAVQYLSFTVLNTLAASIGHELLPLAEYECKWRPKTAVFSEFVVSEPENSPLTQNHLTVIKHTHPDGFVIHTRNVKPDLFSHAVRLAS